jgi:hypothetical protein
VFDAIDFNKDGYISEIDLFSTMGSSNDVTFTQILYNDFQAINKTLIFRKKIFGRSDPIKLRMDKLKKNLKSMWVWLDLDLTCKYNCLYRNQNY